MTLVLSALEEDILQNEEDEKDVHKDTDLLRFATGQINHDVEDNSPGNTFSNAVEERHGQQGNVRRDSLRDILEIHLENRSKHQVANVNQGSSGRKSRDAQEERS